MKIQKKTLIKIELKQRNLYFLGNNRIGVYPVAIGKPSTPSPVGTWQVIEKKENPGWILGSRWLGLNVPWGYYGIHGTTNPASIGKAVSNGCIRLYNHDIEEIYPLIPMGAIVEVVSGKTATETTTAVRIYVIQPGDTLYKIASRYGVKIEDLVAANNLVNPNLIYPGAKLLIP